MEEWKKYKIGDLCSISSSKRIFAKEYQSSGVPFFRGKEIIEKQKGGSISTELYISRSRYEEIKIKYGVPKEGDMLLTSVGTLGVPYIVKNETFYFKDGNLTWFSDFKGLNSKFLYYWFLSPIAKNAIEAKAIGSTQKALTIDALSKFEINIPDIDTQNRIASVLSFIDDKIKLNRRINDNLEQQAQALFKLWFVDFEPFKDGKFVDSELGMIPEGWRVGNLLDIAKLYDAKRKPLSSRERENMKKLYPYYGATSIMDYVDKYIFDGTYLLMGEDGSVMDDKGHPYLQYVFGKFWPNNHAHIMQGKNNFSTEMLHCLLLKKNISPIVTGAVQAKISQSNMRKILIIQPPHEITIIFSSLIKPIYEIRKKNELENQRLSILRDTLLPKLMSGELKINDINN